MPKELLACGALIEIGSLALARKSVEPVRQHMQDSDTLFIFAED